MPVARHSAARVSPLRFFAAVERGIGHRIGADPRYTGLIAKNPLHSDWRAYWRRELPYPLEELADCLFQRDLAIDLLRATTFGAGRNCSLFDALRAIAYRDWRECHYSGDGEAFPRHLERVAFNINAEFPVPLRGSEVRAFARSVARWVARHFTAQRFLHRQSTLGIRGNKKRWAGHIAAESTKPWQAAGISRRT